MTKTSRESWAKYGMVSVTRDDRGRFVHWEFIKNLIGYGKAVSVYGRCRTTFGEYSARYDFEYGSPHTGTIYDVRNAIAFAIHYPPRRRHVTVGAREYLERPMNYGTRGYWVEKPTIDS